MTELASLNTTNSVDPLFSPAARSPEFLLVDEESASTYPLLTPSPPAEFDHPLALDNTQVHAYERQLSPSSIDTELCSLPAIGNTAGGVSTTNFSNLESAVKSDVAAEKGPGELPCNTLETRSNGMGSSSSSSSVLQDTAASAQLLNPHHYHNLAGDVTCQENGGIKPVLCGLQLGVRKSQQDYNFVKWNWPLIRKFCFWSVMSMMVACVCIVITYVTTLPARCDPPRSWYHGSLIYEIFPGSFKDSNNDGIGDLKGITSKVDYLRSLGVQGIRLNSIFPSEHYPEDFHNIENLTQIEHVLGRIDDFRILVKTLHKNNISIILDVPLHPYLRGLGAEDPSSKTLNRKQDSNLMTHVIVNNHILNGNLNKTDLNTFHPNMKNLENEKSAITRVLEFWLHEGVDGFYLKGLEKYTNDDNFVEQIEEWRSILHKSKDGFDKILICSVKVIMDLEKEAPLESNPKLTTVLTHFSLIDVYIKSLDNLSDQLNYVQKGVLHTNPGYPWVLWTTGGIETPRLASRLTMQNETLAAIALQMMLPGTPSLFYGDEVGIDNFNDQNGERSDISHVHNLAPMKWSLASEGRGFTQPVMLPWFPEAIAYGPADGPKIVSAISSIRDTNPSIYMHAIWKDRQLLPNCFIRYNDGNLLLLERTYPRRYTHVIAVNIGKGYAVKDLSKLFYGGHVLLDQKGRSGYFIKFNHLALNQGEFLLIRLDK